MTMDLRAHRRQRLHLQGQRTNVPAFQRTHSTSASALACGGGFVPVSSYRRRDPVRKFTGQLGSISVVRLIEIEV